eukprot:g1501.t1
MELLQHALLFLLAAAPSCHGSSNCSLAPGQQKPYENATLQCLLSGCGCSGLLRSVMHGVGSGNKQVSTNSEGQTGVKEENETLITQITSSPVALGIAGAVVLLCVGAVAGWRMRRRRAAETTGKSSKESEFRREASHEELDADAGTQAKKQRETGAASASSGQEEEQEDKQEDEQRQDTQRQAEQRRQLRTESVEAAVDPSSGRDYYYNKYTQRTGWTAEEVSRATTNREYGLDGVSDANEHTSNPMFS